MQTFKEFTEENMERLTQTLRKSVQSHTDAFELELAMQYSLNAGGKRFRPMLFLAVVFEFEKELRDAHFRLASSIEMIHTYSLIHDDLPSMDNDDLRRGKPTNHKVFGEAMAILAGDGLLTLAFELAASSTVKVEILQILAKYAGVGRRGMVAGQVLDIEAEQKKCNLEELKNIHAKKTGGLMMASVEMALKSVHRDFYPLVLFAEHLGIAFQIRDDILDVTATTEELGKTAGKDIAMEKSTYPSLLGLVGAKEELNKEIEQARTYLIESKRAFGKEFSLLDSILNTFVV